MMILLKSRVSTKRTGYVSAHLLHSLVLNTYGRKIPKQYMLLSNLLAVLTWRSGYVSKEIKFISKTEFGLNKIRTHKSKKIGMLTIR